MKRLTFFLVLFLASSITRASITLNIDTNKSKLIFTAVERPPEYPGGAAAFNKHILKNLKYPDVARVIGINGRVDLQFVVDREGKMVEITPMNCIGAGCESEAVKALQLLKTWKPGIVNGKPVRVQYTVPINFIVEKDKVSMNDLRSFNYGFLFNIKGIIYTLDEAQVILGKFFKAEQVEIAEPFFNADSEQKFMMPDKKEIYIVKIKE